MHCGVRQRFPASALPLRSRLESPGWRSSDQRLCRSTAGREILGAQSLQLPKIGADLENIAAALADAQKAGAARIATLDAQLKSISDAVVQAVALLDETKVSARRTKTRCMPSSTLAKTTPCATPKPHSLHCNRFRNGYSNNLQKSLESLHAEGADGAALYGADADGVAPPNPAQQAVLADIGQVTNQAVIDQIGQGAGCPAALNKAAADLYTHGPGSPEGEAASARLPEAQSRPRPCSERPGQNFRLQQH